MAPSDTLRRSPEAAGGGTPLPTPSGFMVGTYQMETGDGNKFDVAVPAFSLDSPHQPVKLN